jgi:UDP-glucose 4-epimerase
MKILVTGGTGYIGSHTCVQLLEIGWQPVIIDSLVNSKISVLDRIHQITGTRPAFIEGDVRDADLLQKVLREHAIEAVIHFAGLKAVGESVSMPLKYYDNNVHGSVVLMDAMK